MTASKDTQTAVVSAYGNGSVAQLFASTGSQPTFGLRGSLALRGAQLDIDASHSPGTTGGTLQLRTTHPGINLAGGIDLSSGAARPLLGFIVPVTPSLSVETAMIRGTSGGTAIRLSIVAGFRNRKVRTPTFPLAITLDRAQATAPLRLFIDGAAVGLLRDGRAKADITAGSHDVYVATTDGAFGSPQREIVAGVDRNVTVTLVPQLSLRGRVRFAARAGQVSTEVSLQGVHVILVPSGAHAVCDADGVFIFPRAPYDPQSQVLVDPSTVPPGFVAPAPSAMDASAELDIPLDPARGVERQIFR